MTQAQNVATQDTRPPIDRMCASLVNDDFKAKLQQALPDNIEVEKFVRTTINAIQMHPQQDKFNNCDVRTVFLSCQKAAADGLMLDGREATLIAYWNKDKRTNDISYVPMVQGLVKAARNSGEISDISAYVVYENDKFMYRPGIDAQPLFEPDWKMAPSQRGEPVLAYCVITLKDETIIAPEPLHRERIAAIGNGGNNGKQYDPKQGKHWMEWWKKTAIKNALKYAPKSAELLALDKVDNDAQQFQFERDVTPGGNGATINELFAPSALTEEEKEESFGETIDQEPEQEQSKTKQPAKKAAKAKAEPEPEAEPAGPTKAYESIEKLIDMANTEADLDGVLSLPQWSDLLDDEKPALNKLVETKRDELKAE